MSFNYSPKVVTNGLVLCLDAANQKSYVSGSTLWNDLSQTKTSGSLTNGPTYGTSNGGCIVFDGTNDYVNFPHFFNISQGGVTWNFWFNCSSSAWSPLMADWASPQYSFLLQVYNGATSISFRNSSNTDLQGNLNTYPISTNTTYNICCTYDPLSKITNLYANGNFYASSSNAQSDSYIRNTSNNISIGLKQDSGGSTVFSGNFYYASVYNRALSSTEISQNYNTLKTRFGL